MARAIIEDGSGAVTDSLPKNPGKDGLFAGEIFRLVKGVLSSVVQRINGKLSFGSGLDGYRSGNFDAQYRVVTSPSVANTEFLVDHGLGRIPVGYDIIRKSAAATVYDSSATTWTTDVIKLKCNQASIQLWFRIF